MELAPPLLGEGVAEGLGVRALDALLGWDGSADSILPAMVIERLNRIPRSLPPNMELWLGDDKVPRTVILDRQSTTRDTSGSVCFWCLSRLSAGMPDTKNTGNL